MFDLKQNYIQYNTLHSDYVVLVTLNKFSETRIQTTIANRNPNSDQQNKKILRFG